MSTIMQNNNNEQKQAQPGTGSAENKGNSRNEQMNNQTNLSPGQKQEIASEIGEDASSISSIQDTGALSGRDDASGGSGDRMENQNTGQTTDR